MDKPLFLKSKICFTQGINCLSIIWKSYLSRTYAKKKKRIKGHYSDNGNLTSLLDDAIDKQEKDLKRNAILKQSSVDYNHVFNDDDLSDYSIESRFYTEKFNSNHHMPPLTVW